jgi:FAD/FMN-containing dehydrogenase
VAGPRRGDVNLAQYHDTDPNARHVLVGAWRNTQRREGEGLDAAAHRDGPRGSGEGTPTPTYSRAVLDRRAFLRRAGAVVVAGGALRSRGEFATAASPPLSVLRNELQGDLVQQGASGYSQAKLVYDTRFNATKPLAIAYCESASDVSKCLLWAQQYKVAFAARSGGHSYAGYSTTTGLVIDVSRMKSVTASGDTATIGAGAQLIDIYSALWNRHRSIAGGSCPTVGIAGLALYSSRLHGTTCDNVLSFKLVDAAGKVRTCSASENADLYWACRGGGGGNFGIVTSFKFKTFQVGNVATFFVEWPWSDAQAAVDAWQRWAPSAPDGLFSDCVLSTESGSPVVRASGQFFGSASQLRSLLAPLLVGQPVEVDVVGRTYMNAVMYWAGCTGTVKQCHLTPDGNLPRATFKATSDYAAKQLSANGIKTMVTRIEQRQKQGAGIGVVILDSYGGAINRVSPTATAFVHRKMLFGLQYGAYWSGNDGGTGIQWAENLRQAMQPYVTGAAYVNYIDPSLPNWARAYYGSNYQRLQSVKKSVDPENVFHFPQSIRLPG